MERIGILSPFSANQAGGISTFSRNLKAEFERRFGLDCWLATPPDGTLSASRRPLFTLISSAALLLQLIKRKPRAVFVQAHPALLLSAIVYARLFPGCAIVFTFHTASDRLSPSKARILERLLARCHAITFVSSHLAERVGRDLRLPISPRSQVVLPGVALEPSPPSESAEIARLARGRRPILSYVGAMAWEGKVEGLKILIAALAEVRKEWPGILLLVAGTGAREGEARRVCKDLGLERHVAFLGAVRSPEACLKSSDAYVHVSLHENLSLAILEAMASGVPVIASDTGAIREVVEDGQTGFLVEPRVADVSRAILWLLSHSEIAHSVGEAGQKAVLRRFSWERAAREFLGLAGVLPRAARPSPPPDTP